MEIYNQLLRNNKEWAHKKALEDPDFFKRLANSQHPEVMWIGCSDSRVPANVITGAGPGELFVHRNISNMVIPMDLNLMSDLQFAVDVLHIKHIIVCGHENCGGIAAAFHNDYHGLLDQWTWHIKGVFRLYQEEIKKEATEADQIKKFIHLNIREQVGNLAKTPIIQKAWKERKYPHLHGWVYDVADGEIRLVCEMPVGSEIEPIYKIFD